MPNDTHRPFLKPFFLTQYLIWRTMWLRLRNYWHYYCKIQHIPKILGLTALLTPALLQIAASSRSLVGKHPTAVSTLPQDTSPCIKSTDRPDSHMHINESPIVANRHALSNARSGAQGPASPMPILARDCHLLVWCSLVSLPALWMESRTSCDPWVLSWH